VFNWLSSISAVSNCFTWGSVSIAYLGFRKALRAQGVDRDTLPYKAPFQPYATYLALGFFIVVIVFSGFPAFVGGFDYEAFVTSYITIPVFFLLYFGYKIVRKTKVLTSAEVDLFSGKTEIDAEDAHYVDLPPGSVGERFWDWLF